MSQDPSMHMGNSEGPGARKMVGARGVCVCGGGERFKRGRGLQ